MFVIQEREKPWLDKWVVLHSRGRFKTIDEARAVMEKLPGQPNFKHIYRIAEEYTVVRYKVIKEVKGG